MLEACLIQACTDMIITKGKKKKDKKGIFCSLNSLPNDKNLDWSNFRAFADDKINVNEKLKSGLKRVENFVGKGEKWWLPAFSPFPTMF